MNDVPPHVPDDWFAGFAEVELRGPDGTTPYELALATRRVQY